MDIGKIAKNLYSMQLLVGVHTSSTHMCMGWKSNDKHRTCGMSIKKTRFILPNNSSIVRSLEWNALQRLGDIDKVFAMLDDKAQPEVSLVYAFENHMTELRNGERISTSYFDVRYYPGIGTIHFFAKEKKLLDRLNRLVGRHREWLPPEGEKVNEAFWLQYESAEKFDKEVRVELKKTSRGSYDDPLWGINSRDEETRAIANRKASGAIETVLERRGISINAVLSKEEVLMLEVA